jgi:hypothetical protein
MAGLKIYMDNFFSSPDLSDNLHTEELSTVVELSDRTLKGMPGDFDNKTLKLK